MAEVIQQNGKYFLIYNNQRFNLPESYDLDVGEFFLDDDDFIFDRGRAVAVVLEGEEFKLSKGNSSASHGSRQGGNRNQQNNRRNSNRKYSYKGEKVSGRGTAPYNFISLPKRLHQSASSFNRSHHVFVDGLLHGHIDFDIRTMTPLMIRGKKDEFYKVNDQAVIPGASVRGLISTMVEIISGGKFWSYNDRRIYQRAMFPDGTSANEYYMDQRPETKGGFIKFDRSQRCYYLLECSRDPEPRQTGNHFTPFTIKFNSRVSCFEVNSGKMNNKKTNWNIFPDIDFPASFNNSDALVKIPTQNIQDYENDLNRQLGAGNSKDKFVNPLTLAKRISKLRNSRNDLDAAFLKYGIPVFYSSFDFVNEVGEKETNYTFGHTKNYRIPYHKTIGEHIPPELKVYAQRESEPAKIEASQDIRTSLFGDTRFSAGKLQFEDLRLEDSGEDSFMRREVCKVLGTPNASYYPGYLHQPQGINTKLKDLSHWGTEENGSEIRGYKLYHHIIRDDFWVENRLRLNIFHIRDYFTKYKINQSEQQVVLADINYDPNGKNFFIVEKKFSDLKEASKKLIHSLVFSDKLPSQQFSILKPVKANQVFKGGRIRFSNLSSLELGVLLYALELDGKAVHKMGYAKPYGLGSVKFENINVVLEDRQKRYLTVFDDAGDFETGQITPAQKDKEIEAAKKACLGFMNCETEADFFKIDRIKDLLNILGWDEKLKSSDAWLEVVKYMNLKQFKDKPVLPTLDEMKLSSKEN